MLMCARLLLEGDSLSLHHSMLLSHIHWGMYRVTAWVRKIQIFFIVLYWDWEWSIDQSYGRTNVALFQIMCFKAKMNVFYNTATWCLFFFLTFYYSCIEEFIEALLNGFRIYWFFHCIEAAGELLNSTIISWSR